MVENLLRLMTETIRVIRHWLGLFVKGKVMKCSKNGLKSLGGETAIFAGVSCQRASRCLMSWGGEGGSVGIRQFGRVMRTGFRALSQVFSSFGWVGVPRRSTSMRDQLIPFTIRR